MNFVKFGSGKAALFYCDKQNYTHLRNLKPYKIMKINECLRKVSILRHRIGLRHLQCCLNLVLASKTWVLSRMSRVRRGETLHYTSYLATPCFYTKWRLR